MQPKRISRCSVLSFFGFFDNYLPLNDIEIARLLSLELELMIEIKKESCLNFFGEVSIPSNAADIVEIISYASSVMRGTANKHGLPDTRGAELIGIIDGHSGSIEAMIRSGKPYLITKAVETMTNDFRCSFPKKPVKFDFSDVFKS